MTTVDLRHGDCLDVLRSMPDCSVDAVVTDPPAGIGFMGKEWDDYRRARNPADTERDDVFGRTSRSGPEYGRAREGFIAMLTPIMVECLRVLKPGGHALVWAIPRTSHWTATAIEDAGFEVRDVLTHHFGSGFPKSLDVSKAIDRAAGAEREVIAPDPQAARRNRTTPQFGGSSMHEYDPGYDGPEGRMAVTAPATDDARRWSGWGTSLKPSSEHWILARKPLGGTVAKNVVEHGTGALNIEGCRIASVPHTDRMQRQRANTAGMGGLGGGGYSSDHIQPMYNKAGRWPPNVLLTHSAKCRRVGERRVATGITYETGDGNLGGMFGGGRMSLGRTTGYADVDGKETIPAYECDESCPVRKLDEQSGTLTSGLMRPDQKRNGHSGGFGFSGNATTADTYADSSGASRFFPTFEYDEDDLALAERFLYTAKADAEERHGAMRERDGRAARATHPTIKPIALMRWLCRLITPPGGLVLDPFAGSGTTLLAAHAEGFRAVGIEREAEYVEIARQRIVHATRQVEMFK